MDGADVCRTSSRASRRTPNVVCGAAILDSRWRRRKWRQPGLGASFSIPIEGEVQNGDPSASGGHLGWPHLRNRKWGHPRWPPEAEGPPFCTSPSMGIEKLALYYSCYRRCKFILTLSVFINLPRLKATYLTQIVSFVLHLMHNVTNRLTRDWLNISKSYKC